MAQNRFRANGRCWFYFLLIALCIQSSNSFAVQVDSTGIRKCEAIFQYAVELMGPSKAPEPIFAAADSLIQEAEAVGAYHYVGRALYVKGSTLSGTSDREKGRKDLERAVHILDLTKDSLYLQRSHYSLAANHYLMESYEQAIIHAEQSIEMARITQDIVPLAMSINLLALIQRQLGNHELAISYLEKGIDEVGPRIRHILLQNLGVVYKDLEQYDKAKMCFEKVAAHHDSTGLKSSLLIALSNLGTVEIRLGRPEKALEYLTKAEGLLVKNTSLRTRALLEINIGVVHQDMGSCEKALPYFLSARMALEELKEGQNLVLALENEAECLFLTNQARKAYELLDRSRVLSDSLFSLERSEAIAELEQQYRQKEQQQKIKNLEQKNDLAMERSASSERSIRNQYIILALLSLVIILLVFLGFALFRAQRNRLLQHNEADKQQLLRQQIKPHFIFNALNSVQHFLLHDQKKDGLLYLGKFGSLLRLILNNSQKDLIPVSEELILIRHYLEMEQIRTNHKFDFDIIVKRGLDPEQIQIPGMILQVLVENAIWHGASKVDVKGQITVRVEYARGAVKVSIQDNGPGISDPILPTKGQHRSLGLELVRKRLKRSFWNDVRYEFELRNLIDAQGNICGTQASIVLTGNSLIQ